MNAIALLLLCKWYAKKGKERKGKEIYNIY